MTYCPYCDELATLSPFDGGFVCMECGALEIGERDEVEELAELESLTSEEVAKGWYKPGTIFDA